jgi:hypothetical protein
MKIGRYALGLFVMFLSLSGFASEGSTIRGGGDLEGVRPKTGPWEQSVETYFADRIAARRDLIGYLSTLRLMAFGVEAIDDHHRQILDLIEKGLIEDVQNAPYELRSSCFDESGRETTMSTSKAVPRAPVCVNLPRVLAQLGVPGSPEASRNLVTLIPALLAHEHARHLGVEDVSPTGEHPLATFVARTIEQVSWTSLRDNDFLERVGGGVGRRKLDNDGNAILFIPPGTIRAKLIPVRGTSRSCRKAKFAIVGTREVERTVAQLREEGELEWSEVHFMFRDKQEAVVRASVPTAVVARGLSLETPFELQVPRMASSDLAPRDAMRTNGAFKTFGLVTEAGPSHCELQVVVRPGDGEWIPLTGEGANHSLSIRDRYVDGAVFGFMTEVTGLTTWYRQDGPLLKP